MLCENKHSDPSHIIALLKCSKHDHQLDQVLENFKFSFYFGGITFCNGFKPKRRLYGCLPFTKTFRKIRLECKWYTTFRVVPVEISGSNGKSEKAVLFLISGRNVPNGNSCSIWSNLIFQALAAIFCPNTTKGRKTSLLKWFHNLLTFLAIIPTRLTCLM